MCATLPDPSEWPCRPIYLVAEDGVDVKGQDESPLPLGVPIEFESAMFKGRFFLRLKDINHHADEAKSAAHAAYFEGRKRFYQLILQGQFKDDALSFNDVVLGDVYDRPLKGVPKGKWFRIIKKFVEAISPGIMFDVGDAVRPKVLAPIGGVQTLRVDLPGDEPSDFESLVENTALLGKFSSVEKRRKALSNPKTAARYALDTKHVYTFEVFDHSMDFGSYHQHVLSYLKIDLVPSLDGQSLSLGMYKRQCLTCLFNFSLWHERALKPR